MKETPPTVAEATPAKPQRVRGFGVQWRDAITLAVIVACSVTIYFGLLRRDGAWPMYVLASGAAPVVALSLVSTLRTMYAWLGRRRPSRDESSQHRALPR